MPNTDDKTDKDAGANIIVTKAIEVNEHGPRGNFHSEKDDTVDQDAPPPMPN